MAPRRLLTLLLIGACAEERPFLPGAGEPVVVVDGTFQAGPLPEDPDATTPVISNAAAVGTVVTQGQGSVDFQGLASPDTYAVAVAFPGLGDGYWTVPVDGPDVTANNQLGFQLTAGLSLDAPFGLQQLGFVPIDGQGRPGPRYDSALCILPESAQSRLTACDPTVAPQARVITLTWNNDADLDLVVVTPEGKVVSAKAPTTAPQTGTDPIPSDLLNAPTTGRLSRDSNGGCVRDGIRRESLVFPGLPPEGTWAVYVRLHAACGTRAVSWRLDRFDRMEPEPAAEGEDTVWQPVVTTPLAAGQLLDLQADGGAGLGTHAVDVLLP